MRNNNIYINFTIKKVKEIDNIFSINETNGNFLIQNYYRFVRHDETNNQP